LGLFLVTVSEDGFVKVMEIAATGPSKIKKYAQNQRISQNLKTHWP
jgi:hypothetical protein